MLDGLCEHQRSPSSFIGRVQPAFTQIVAPVTEAAAPPAGNTAKAPTGPNRMNLALSQNRFEILVSRSDGFYIKVFNQRIEHVRGQKRRQ